MNLQEYQKIAQDSYGRCRLASDFLPDFYQTFFGGSPKIREKFHSTDMAVQQQVLDYGLRHLIRFYHEPAPVISDRIAALGKLHAKSRLNIEPELYDLWLSALIDTLRRHDSRFDATVEQAWREVAGHGIAAMRSRYYD